MKIKYLIGLISCCSTLSFADNFERKTCIPNQPTSSENYNAVKWYRDSAERVAQYRQVFALGFERIEQKIKHDKLKQNQWGVILDIDDTVLDNSEYEKNHVYSCESFTPATFYQFVESETSPATPGAVQLTCNVKKMGGKVVLVTNRDGTYDQKIQQATLDNLQKAGICFDNVVFANGATDDDKTPRFLAINSGNYESVVASNKQMKAFKAIAYFGDNIQDFPYVKQNEAIQESANSKFYDKFGQEYFSLPNPRYGSWQKNQFK